MSAAAAAPQPAPAIPTPASVVKAEPAGAARAEGQPQSQSEAQQQDRQEEQEKRWQPVMNLPCQLTVDLELPGVRVSDLLKLGPGTVLGSRWPVRKDVPLRVNGTLIGWSEFEVVGEKLAVRLTELA